VDLSNLSTQPLQSQDWVLRYRMRRTAQSCLVSIYGGDANAALRHRAQFLQDSLALSERGVTVGSMIEEAILGARG
jgi:hypothetical protein